MMLPTCVSHCPISIVYPSGAARATRPSAMLPPAPPTFSMMTGCPSDGRIASARMRAAVSVDPPGGNGTITVTGRDGQVCAAARPADAASASAANSFAMFASSLEPESTSGGETVVDGPGIPGACFCATLGGGRMKLRTTLLGSALLLCFAQEALCDSGTWILATGRRIPLMYAINLKQALRPENDGTPNAIVSRSKVALDRLDGKVLGDSANIVISEDRRTAYVVNHHGAINNDEFLQHGGRGNIAVMNIRKMIDRRNNNTAAALARHTDSGHFGSVGL